MADITYTRTFAHTDWIDGESIVQADGNNGLNIRFHGCEAEFDKLSTTIGQVNTAIKNIQQLTFLASQPPLVLAANSSTAEFDVEVYDRTGLPANVEKAYFCVIAPGGVPAVNVLHTFLYRPVPGNKMHVTITFYNPTGAQATFSYRILALGTHS